MSLEVLLAGSGIIMIAIGLLGRLESEKFRVRHLPNRVRLISVSVGVVLLAISIFIFFNPPDIKKRVSEAVSLTQTAQPTATQTASVKVSLPSDTPSSVGTESLGSPPLMVESDKSTIYDDFNDTAYDGNYQNKKWFLDSSAGNVFQQDGMLAIQVDSSKGNITSLQAVSYHEFSIDSPMFFEAKLRVDAPQSGYVYMLIISPPSALRINTDCEAGGSNGATFGCGYHNNGSFEDYQHLTADYGTWHTVRIEINPSTMTITHYIDGTKIKLISAENLNTDKFTFEIGFYNDANNQVYVGFVDDVQIGKIE